MKKIKILRIIARLNIGGPAIHVILLTEGLGRSRFTSLLACGSLGREEGDMGYYARKHGVVPYYISTLKRQPNFFDDILSLAAIFRLIRKEKPDIIHTHTAKAGAVGRIAGILYNLSLPFGKRVKIVHTFHGHVFRGYFNRLKSAIFILIERALALFTDRIVTLSPSLKDELIGFRICPAEKIEVIPLGLELENLLCLMPRVEPVLQAGIVGRLVPIKNHRLFLDAANLVFKNNPDLRLEFRVIGDGELSGWLKKYSVSLGLGERVKFLGWQREPEGIYAGLDIVCLTSINEGTPLSLIEAMAAGRQVIACDAGGVRDLLGAEDRHYNTPGGGFKVLERGILVRPDDAVSFAKALEFLLGKSELRRGIAERSRLFARDNFSKERLIQDIESLYQRIL